MANYVLLSPAPLNTEKAQKEVSSPLAGAISIFVGTTRDNFHGKRVLCLEYEAYEEMAIAEMKKLCVKAREKFPNIIAVAIHHRLGVVPIGEASVIIAVSSPHRADAIACCQFAIDELKAVVPIWKKEKYDDGSTWKSNASTDGNLPL